MSGNDASAVRLKYEREHDLLSVWLRQIEPYRIDTVEVEPGICVRLDDDGNAIGVEITDASARLRREPAALENPAFAATLVRKYGQRALAVHP